jgi:hypothetical protein
MSDEDNVRDLGAYRKEKRRKTQSEKEQDHEDLLEAADAFLDQYPMWEVLKLGCYYKRRMDGTAIPVKADYLKRHHTVWNAKFEKAITCKLEERGWTYNDATYSFRTDLPSDMLNLLDKSRWIEPRAGKYDPIFDTLCWSIGGGKDENIEHLSHCITHKYLHPEDYTIPNLVIHGEGGGGKNLMVNVVLKRVFDGGTFSAESENVVGQFNNLIAGKALVMIDESMASKTSAGKMKLIAGNPFITVNPKNIPQFEADNTAWYWVGSNEKESGGIWLDRSNADRRYSVFHIEDGNTLTYWIALSKDWITSCHNADQYEEASAKAKRWLDNEGLKHLQDPRQIAAWLHALIEKYGNLPSPMALHGADYKRLMVVQERVSERILEAVFKDDDFTHICKTTLYDGYKLCSAAAGEQGKVLDRVLYQKASDWLKKQRLEHIVMERERQDTGRNTIWYDARKSAHIRKIDNTDKYIRKNLDSGRKAWIGPEV